MTLKEDKFHTETGRLSLDWIATLGDRDGTPVERLNRTADLKRWFDSVADQTVGREPTQEDLVEAKNLRAAIIGLIDRLYSCEEPAAKDIRVLNDFSGFPPPDSKLAACGRVLETNADLDAQTILGLIARDAVDLFTGRDFAKIRLCAAEDCSVYFIDRSRPGKRRWCSMNRCGNRAKKKAFTKRNMEKLSNLN